MMTCLLAFALGCIGFATTTATPWIAVVLMAIAGLNALAAVSFAGYALLRRPDLLRSERFNLLNRYIDVVGDHEANRTGLDRTVLAFLDEDVSKKSVPRGDFGSGGPGDADQ